MSVAPEREVDWVLLSADSLDVSACLDHVKDERSGATDLFVGTTRRWTRGRETETLSYEAFDEMAIEQMRGLILEARKRFEVLRTAIHHRTGTVRVGEASVVIAVSTPHRAQAFEACRFLIDRLKEDVPIWKQEHYSDGSTEWVEPPDTGSKG